MFITGKSPLSLKNLQILILDIVVVSVSGDWFAQLASVGFPSMQGWLQAGTMEGMPICVNR